MKTSQTSSYTDLLIVENPLPMSFTQRDSSNGKSYIKVISPNNLQFDNIEIQVTGAANFFHEKAEVYFAVK